MGDFDWKIWLWKGVKEAGIVASAAFLTAFANYIEISSFPPEFVGYAGILILLMNEAANLIKHKYLVN